MGAVCENHPTDDLIANNKAHYLNRKFSRTLPTPANGLVAVTDDPASLGTEYRILPHGKTQPLNRFKLSPENLISVATPVELEFEDLPETVFTALTEKVKSILAANRGDDARLNDVHEAVTAVAEHVQEKLSATEQRLAEGKPPFPHLSRR
ncbi:GPO family capsid scaffolding protein [Escherichia coli]|uniref:GPO family capsid scaffolding protein n=1 Tax=Escherichia coli TaxID=562 RepID=UPI001A13C2E9|nr:hypothetical protein ECZU31_17640 [Escherichia coli]